MLVMGIDTSTMQGGVALISGQGVICEYTLNVRATYSERLLPLIDRALQDARITPDQIDGVAVAVGPGSFTGLRIGLSTAKGLAAAGGQPCVGISTLEARKGEIYSALFRHDADRIIRLADDAAVTLDRLLNRIEQPTVFLGDGLAVCEELIQARLKGLALLAPLAGRGGRPAAVAELGRRRLLRGHQDNLAELAPQYLRPSEAELKRLGGFVPVASWHR